MAFVVDKVALGQVFAPVLRTVAVIVVPPAPRVYIH